MSSTTSFFIIIPLAALLSAAPTSSAVPPTAYEVLQSFDFPVGLLPKDVTSYELDPSTGIFSVYLNGSCRFTIHGYHLKYKSMITGMISTDKITRLNGIQVKVMLFWVNIVKVTKNVGELDFSVGISSTGFPLDSFIESPQCGCGFDCLNAASGKRSRKFSFIKRVAPLLQ